MSFNPTSPVTGATISGLTSPTYTLTVDTAPAAYAKQYAVTALGGTQTSVDTHSVSKPFTITAFRPAQLKVAPTPNPITGVVKSTPVNTYKVITRKGALAAANQQPVVMRMTTVIDIPSGVDTYEPEELRAMFSAHIGVLNQQANGLCDTSLTGIL